MPLPPIPLDEYRKWASQRWADATQALIDAVPTQHWALDAQQQLHDTFTQAQQWLTPPPPPPPPAPPPPAPVDEPPPEGMGPPSPTFGQRVGVEAQNAVGGLGDLNQRATGQLNDWATQASQQIAGLGSGLGDAFGRFGSGLNGTPDRLTPPAPQDDPQAFLQQSTLAPGVDPTQPSGVTPAAPVAPPPGVQGVGDFLGAARDTLSRVPNYSPMALGADLGASLATGVAGPATALAGAAGDAYRTGVLEPGLADQARHRAEERQQYEDFLDAMYAGHPEDAPTGERRRQLIENMLFNADVGASVAGSSLKTVGPATRVLLPSEREALRRAVAAGREAPPEVADAVRRVAGAPPAAAGAPAAADVLAARPGGPARGRIVLADVPELLSSIPLASPTSLAANFTSGLGRSLERVAGKVFEGRPVEALVDLGGMVRELPGAARRVGSSYRAGATRLNPGMTGAATGADLASRGGLLPEAASAGVKANAATDQFWRDLNEAGAGAAAGYRGAGPEEAARLRQSAGDFATFSGPNSQVAKKLTELKAVLRDPAAPFVDKASAWAITSMAPYVLMPERLLRATVGALVPLESGYGLVTALQRGDTAAAREMAGRGAAGLAATTLLTKLYLDGAVTGDPPSDPNERRRREALGAQWNTVALPGVGRVPARYLGSLGMQASAVATTLDAARKAQEKGADPGAVLEAGANGAAKWVLSTSYLSDLADFADKVKSGDFAGAVRQTAAGQPSRLTAPITGPINAADPYEREPTTFPEQVAARTGLRALVPARIDPVTGAPQARAGTGWSRYWGERGDVTTAEGAELARLGVQPRVLSPNEAYAGAKQTPAQRAVLQQALGSETGKAVRETVATQAYQQADDAGKKKLLQAALRRAADEADIVAGDQVQRDAKHQAQRAWAAVPHYLGVKGTPDEIRRGNLATAHAKSVLSDYRKRYGGDVGEARFRREQPELSRLTVRDAVDADVLAAKKKKIEQQYGVDLP